MKKLFTLLALMLCVMFSAKAADTFTLRGNLQGLPDGAVLQFIPLSHFEHKLVLEATVNGGQFTATGSVEEPTAVVMIVKGNYGTKNFILENADITLTGNIASSKPNEEGKIFYDLDPIAVTGSPLTDRYNELMAPRYALNKQMEALQKEAGEYYNRLGELKKAGDEAGYKAMEESPEYAALREKEGQLFSQFDTVLNEAVKNAGDTFFAPLMMIAQTAYLTAEQKPMYEAFSQAVKDSKYGKEVHRELYPVGEMGELAPAISGIDANGKPITLKDACLANKVVLIDFWASWCRPCRKEIPNLKAIYEKHHDQGFEIFSVSRDEDEAKWRKAMEIENMPWTNLRDIDGSIADSYSVSSIPTMYLVNHEGQLIGMDLRGEELAKFVDELFR